ncbi:MAG: sulfurtransferase [Flavobacteriaceae bacterium]|nr:sulfurtransferase [Flavobacteriaceae bacterium]
MNWRISLLLILIVFTACEQEKKTPEPTASIESDEPKSHYLIEANSLKKIAENPDIKIIDFRKFAIYKKEHIKNSLHIWRTDIESASYPYKGMMASKKQLESLFSRLGIKTSDTLVIYDNNGLVDAARLWWVLQNYNFTNVKLLHGGFSAWKSDNGDVTNARTVIKKSMFKLTKNPSLKYNITKEEVLLAIKNKVVLLDTRTTDEFTGKRHKKGAAKGGRIPTSTLIDWAEAIDYSGSKKIKKISNLNRIYGGLTTSKKDQIIVYCHSGVRSAHTTLYLLKS